MKVALVTSLPQVAVLSPVYLADAKMAPVIRSVAARVRTGKPQAASAAGSSSSLFVSGKTGDEFGSVSAWTSQEGALGDRPICLLCVLANEIRKSNQVFV